MKSTSDRAFLLNSLWDCQQRSGYISDDDVALLSEEYGISRIEVEGVISFYHYLSRQSRGKFTIYLNRSILSELNGYAELKEAFESAAEVVCGSVSKDGLFGLYQTSCIGLSDREPAALINFYPFTDLTPGKVWHIINRLKGGEPPESIADSISENVLYKPENDKCILLNEFIPGKAIENIIDKSAEEIIKIVKDSELRGRGGAFFPTGLKWESCRKSSDERKYIVCNADEGEPGSFKDRALISLYPGLLIEGMIIAAKATGADEGIIYLRAEYFWLKNKLQNAIDQYRKSGYLGETVRYKNIPAFDIRIQMGAGAYICGEETALLESMEGKRGEPRVKIFFPTDKGFKNKPTVINNVETLCTVARILEYGVEKFRSAGKTGSTGTKLLCIAGDCRKPGIYEIEWGMTVGELLQLCEAEDPYFIQLSGPSGELISMEEKDRKISLDDIRCEGSVMIFNSHRDLLTILQNFSEFFTSESCGICTPCRAGNPQLLRKIEKIKRGNATKRDLDEILSWASVIRNNSRCGLGVSAPNSISHAINKFPQILHPLLRDENLFNPDFDLLKATEDYNHLIHGKK